MYQVTFRSLAADEYSEATTWYAQRSNSAAENFINAIEEKLDIISVNPRLYKNIYRKYYETGVPKYPYTIVYIIEEKLKRIIIISIYHHKRNPKNKYRR